MKKLYFIVGSQDLYGEECLKQVAEDSRQMVAFLNEKVGDLEENVAEQLKGQDGLLKSVFRICGKLRMMMTVSALSHGCTPSPLQKCGSRVCRN